MIGTAPINERKASQPGHREEKSLPNDAREKSRSVEFFMTGDAFNDAVESAVVKNNCARGVNPSHSVGFAFGLMGGGNLLGISRAAVFGDIEAFQFGFFG